MSVIKVNKLLDELNKMFPDIKSDLNYSNTFELLIAVVLSAQTTDQRVNSVTRKLFSRFPDPYRLANARQMEVEETIASLGLFRTKAENIIALSKRLVSTYKNEVPDNLEDLLTLPGVGRKTANVVLSEGFGKPAIAVDTHVSRVSKRLGLTKSDNPDKIELDLQEYFPKDKWGKAHLLLVHFGRYHCKAQNPQCSTCPFNEECLYYKQNLT